MKKQHLVAQVEASREQIEGLHAEKERILSGMIPKDDAIARALTWLDAQAERFEGKHHIFGVFGYPDAHDHECGLMRVLANIGVPDEGGPHADVGPLLAWLFKDLIAQRLREAIASANYTPGPPMAERAPLLKALDRKLWDVELEEEHLIEQAEGQGIEIARRPDARPEVILALPAVA
jgi:hypothetical protein